MKVWNLMMYKNKKSGSAHGVKTFPLLRERDRMAYARCKQDEMRG